MWNFRMPYFSGSPSEFWQRWHISLSSWLRDYLYIPLGGNRHGTWMTARNLSLTMLLGGLWHGANWTFIAWGALHGLVLVLYRVFPFLGSDNDAGRRYERLWRLVKVTLMFHIVCVTWVFFRAESIGQAFGMLGALAGPWGLGDPFVAYALGMLAFFVLPFMLYELWLERQGDQLALMTRPALAQAAVLATLCSCCWCFRRSSRRFSFTSSSDDPKQPGESWGNFQEFLTCAAPLTPQPRVLFMVREHQSWLWSSYLQRYKRRKVNEPFVRFVTRFSLADLSWAERIDQLRAHFEHVLVLDQQAFRTVQTATLQQIADFAELPLTASQLEQIQATAGRSNPSPQTQLALQAHRLLVSNRPLWQLCKHLSWGRIQYREQLSAPLNRLGGERLTAPELPPALKVALAEDWAATGERLRMYRKETDRGS
jgi:hypothetical protein